MNENIDLTEILKDCPEGWTFYSPICGKAKFSSIKEYDYYPINLRFAEGTVIFSKEGFFYNDCEGTECLLFPSQEQRDWSKFEAPWYKKGKKDRFDPETLKPFDKVLVRDKSFIRWRCTFYSHLIEDETTYKYVTAYNVYKCCIPYNDDTKHLVGTKAEAPEYYRYWED